MPNRRHHPLFESFERWGGIVTGRIEANWLGVQTDIGYANWDAHREACSRRSPLARIDTEEYAEWIDLLDAVIGAGDRFAMDELGAGGAVDNERRVRLPATAPRRRDAPRRARGRADALPVPARAP